MRYDKISWMMMATKFVRRPSLSSISAPASSTKIRAFLLERGVAVRQGLRFLRAELPRILAAPPEVRRLAWYASLRVGRGLARAR
jgi:hypothetical protein